MSFADLAHATGGRWTVRQLAFVEYLARHPGCSTSEVAAALRVKKPVITRITDALEADGLCKRMVAQHDRRKVYICLTINGETLAWDFIDAVRK